VVLMDPSYELDRDYSAVLAALRDGMQPFADGTFVRGSQNGFFTVTQRACGTQSKRAQISPTVE
jgi:hypothetical protein